MPQSHFVWKIIWKNEWKLKLNLKLVLSVHVLQSNEQYSGQIVNSLDIWPILMHTIMGYSIDVPLSFCCSRSMFEFLFFFFSIRCHCSICSCHKSQIDFAFVFAVFRMEMIKREIQDRRCVSSIWHVCIEVTKFNWLRCQFGMAHNSTNINSV